MVLTPLTTYAARSRCDRPARCVSRSEDATLMPPSAPCCSKLERARYEAELARRRYLKVDPDNRLVADTLEADWNEHLRRLDALQQEHDRQRKADQGLLSDEARARILALSADFPRVCND